jgi:hypothetical protein
MKKAAILGWIAVCTSTTYATVWAFWGAYESFHEGWYFQSLASNLVLTFKYFALMLIFVVLSVISIRLPRVGGSLYQLFGLGFCIWIYMTREVLSFSVVLGFLPMTLPPLLFGILFWKGRPVPAKLAYKISLLVPLAVAIGSGIEPVVRIAGRIDDGNRGQRIVQGNGVRLVWAPEGPGWPSPDPEDKAWVTEWRGPTWEEAERLCRHLTADGKSVAPTPQNIWRLPTIAEVVRSMARHGENCRGVWNPVKARASYAIKPDKESPLWNPYSVIIYWWTSSESNIDRAYCIDFNGNVYSRDKASHMGSQAFRAVRNEPAGWEQSQVSVPALRVHWDVDQSLVARTLLTVPVIH